MIDPDHKSEFRVRDNSWDRLAGKHLIRGHDGVIYNCVQVAMLKEKWKEDFRQKNRTDEIIASTGRDKAYERFSQEIEDGLKCNCYEKALERKKSMESR